MTDVLHLNLTEYEKVIITQVTGISYLCTFWLFPKMWVMSLQKHENEVLAVVEKKADESKRRSRGVTEQRTSRKWEEKERLKFAMKMSITEGWSLLLHLLERRLEVLNLASNFYRQATEVLKMSSFFFFPGDYHFTI